MRGRLRIVAPGAETRTPLDQRTGHVFHAMVPELSVGSRYGLRVHGPWLPSDGLRYNANKLLLAPHAKAIAGSYDWGQSVSGHDLDHPDRLDESDSLGSAVGGGRPRHRRLG